MAKSHGGVRRRSLLKAAGPVALMGLAGCSTNQGSNKNGDGNNNNNNGGGGNGGGGSYNWRIGTSGQETATHASGVAFSNVINKNSDMLQMSAQTTGGTTANPRLIDQGSIDIAQSTSAMVWRANTRRDPYKNPKISKTMCQTFSYMTLDVFLVKRNIDRLSDVKTISDIPTDGSVKMSWGPRGTSAWDTQVDAFKMVGMKNPEKSFNLKVMGLGDQAAAMRDGRLDIANVYTANTKTLIGWIQELDATTNIDVVRYPFDQQTVQKSGKPITYSEVSGDVWNQDISSDSFPTLSLGYMTIIPEDIPKKAVYEYTKVLMENKKSVRQAHSVLSEFGPEFGTKFLVKNGEVPVHPGTEQYLKENDLWSDKLTSLADYQG
ncbi:TAXI family TRAP transporter solute-binding subunit [Haladaptatus halobius]|uniref:TAXI family TRAP transporter solute-binding subunit n=1 Tax=Haladaptatus halobius TaxID=2884875 RepID=UPI001D0AB0C9|nr:TAXI family TRAP transporter solute-binding subunit [Haladaptatus halobius]